MSSSVTVAAFGSWASPFRIERLVDRVVFLTEARGIDGVRWWLDGRMEAKQNTFSDHIAVANQLADTVVDGSRIVTRGLSAGGLLQGAVFSQAPERWCGVIAEVPAVDILTSIVFFSLAFWLGRVETVAASATIAVSASARTTPGRRT